MSYIKKYSIEFQDPQLNNFRVDILQNGFSGDVTTLYGGEATVVISYTNNDQLKYPTILGSGVTINFISTNNFNLQDIITQDDIEYRVEVYYINGANEKLLHRGFLVTDNCTQLAQDDPKPIQLVSSDALARLKETAIYDVDVYERKPLLEYIFHILEETDLELSLLVEIGLFETHMDGTDVDSSNTCLHQAYVHSRSFMTDVNTYDNCYNVLDKILGGLKATIFQQNGRFVIQRRHDRWNVANNSGALFTFPYVIPSDITPRPTATFYDHRVNSLVPINAGHLIGFQGGNKSTKLTYKYTIPDQLPRNANFQQGDFLAPVSGPTNTAYRINYWDVYEDIGVTPGDSTPFRNEVLDADSRLTESYIVLTRNSDGVETVLISQPVEVQAGDRLKVSFETRTRTGMGVDHTFPFIIYIQNGSDKWSLDGETGLWTNDLLSSFRVNYISDTDDWASPLLPTSLESRAFPIDGDLHVAFVERDLALDQTWFRNFKLDFILFKNNPTVLTGEYDNITQDGAFRNAVDNQVYVSDSPKKVINGTITLSDGSLTKTWYRSGVVEAIRLIHINNLAQYQSSYRLMLKLDGDFTGNLYEDPDNSSLKVLVGPQNTFQFAYTTLENKVWIPTNMEINLSEGTSKMSLQEFFDPTLDGGDPMGTNTFNYIYG